MSEKTCLEVKGLSKWFGGLAANLDIDFSVAEGEIVSVIGPNGAGKSTLFNCIMGFYKPNSGKVAFFGKDITRLRADKVCKLGIARTFQVVQIISDMTVLENVVTGSLLRYTSVAHAREKAEEILTFTWNGTDDRRQEEAGSIHGPGYTTEAADAGRSHGRSHHR
jgi:branched-chain amino acid transport system ATP-binding protein